MKRSFFALGVFLCCGTFSLSAQAFEGIIELEFGGKPHLEAFLQNDHLTTVRSEEHRKIKLFIQDENARLEVHTVEGPQLIMIANSSYDHYFTILNKSEKKIVLMHPVTQAKPIKYAEGSKAYLIPTDETRNIHGQTCKLYLYQSEQVEMDLWYTTDFHIDVLKRWPAIQTLPYFSFPSDNSEFPAFCMEANGRNVKENTFFEYSSSVTYQELDPVIFALPAEPISMEKYSLLVEQYMSQISEFRDDPEKLSRLLKELEVLAGIQTIPRN